MAARLDGVIVNADFLADKNNSEATFRSSCSGILLSPKYGIVLTTGALLLPHRNKQRGLINNISSRISQLIGYRDRDNNQLQKITSSIHAKFDILLEKNPQTKRIQQCNAKLLGGCFSERLENDLKKLMRNNAWSPMQQTTTKDFDSQIKLRMAFVLLQIRDNTYPVAEEIETENKELSRLVYQVLVQCWEFVKIGKQGERIWCQSSLFGELSPAVFMNSVSQGVVVNKFGALMLTDARCAPGSEGGVVFVEENNLRFLMEGLRHLA